MREKELIVYRDFEDGELLYDMAFLMSCLLYTSDAADD